MPIGEIPTETARVAKAAFPKGTLVMRLREEFADLFEDADFRALYSSGGQPGLAPWRLALVTVLQFLEQLSDRQAADAVRARIDWKYALGPPDLCPHRLTPSGAGASAPAPPIPATRRRRPVLAMPATGSQPR